MSPNALENVIYRLLDLSGSTAKVVFKNRFPGRRLVGGKYNPVTHTITLYRETIREQCLQMFGTDRYASAFAAIIFAHEAGHAMDPHLQELSDMLDNKELSKWGKSRIALRIEQNAWQFAAKLLSEGPYRALLQEISYQSLEPYYKALVPALRPAARKKPASA